MGGEMVLAGVALLLLLGGCVGNAPVSAPANSIPTPMIDLPVDTAFSVLPLDNITYSNLLLENATYRNSIYYGLVPDANLEATTPVYPRDTVIQALSNTFGIGSDGLIVQNATASGSMAPFITSRVYYTMDVRYPIASVQIGDVIVVSQQPMDIVFANGTPEMGQPVRKPWSLHQVIWRNATHFITQGAANPYPDAIYLFDSHYIGKARLDDSLAAQFCLYAREKINPGLTC